MKKLPRNYGYIGGVSSGRFHLALAVPKTIPSRPDVEALCRTVVKDAERGSRGFLPVEGEPGFFVRIDDARIA